MKNVLFPFLLLSACVASDGPSGEIAFAEPSMERVQKICRMPETLKISPFSPEGSGEIDSRYTFFLGESVEARTLIFIGGFKDGCLRYVLSDKVVVFSVYGLANLLIDIPMLYGFPTLQNWLSRKLETGETLDEFLIIYGRIPKHSPPGRQKFIFGPNGLEAGAIRLNG